MSDSYIGKQLMKRSDIKEAARLEHRIGMYEKLAKKMIHGDIRVKVSRDNMLDRGLSYDQPVVIDEQGLKSLVLDAIERDKSTLRSMGYDA